MYATPRNTSFFTDCRANDITYSAASTTLLSLSLSPLILFNRSSRKPPAARAENNPAVYVMGSKPLYLSLRFICIHAYIHIQLYFFKRTHDVRASESIFLDRFANVTRAIAARGTFSSPAAKRFWNLLSLALSRSPRKRKRWRFLSRRGPSARSDSTI